jgi:hypothetical protein
LQKQSLPFGRAIAAVNCLSGVSYRKKCALRFVIAGHAGCKLGSSCQIGIILMWLSHGKQLMNLSGGIAVRRWSYEHFPKLQGATAGACEPC